MGRGRTLEFIANYSVRCASDNVGLVTGSDGGQSCGAEVSPVGEDLCQVWSESLGPWLALGEWDRWLV